MTKYQYCKN